MITRPFELLHSIRHVLPNNRFTVYACPTVSITATVLSEEQKRYLERAASYDYIVFTSQYAVSETLKHCLRLGLNPAAMNNATLCAGGPMVSAQLEKQGLHVELIPYRYTAEALAQLIPKATKPSKILFPKSCRSPGTLEPLLKKKGYTVDSIEVYQITPAENLCPELLSEINNESIECIAFTSPSSAAAFVQLAPLSKHPMLYQKTTFAAIGATTDATCSALNIRCEIMPKQYTMHSLAREIAGHYAKNQWRPKQA